MTDTQDSDLLAPDLIVLFGNENDENGLKPIAKERCTKAAALAKLFPASLVLPTGGFGAHFNTTNRPHGELLREQLERLGVPAKQILPYTNSCGTLEDVLFARKVAVDRRVKYVAFVTSSFHMQRVRYLCDRVFSEFTRDFAACDADDAHPEEKASEKRKLHDLKRRWVDIPLYGTLGKSSHFPTPVYQNASREHKHYDFISYLFISGMLLSFAFPYTLDASKFDLEGFGFLAFVLSAAFILFFYLMYLRAARFAGQARRVVSLLEAHYQLPGFSLNYERSPSGWRFLGGFRPSRLWGFRVLLAILALLMCLLQAGMAWWFYTQPPDAAAPEDFARVIHHALRGFRAL